MTLLAGLLLFATVPLGVMSVRRWHRRPDQRLRAEASLYQPMSFDSRTSAVRVLRSSDDLTSALERVNASATRVAAARASRRDAAPPRSRAPGH
jgi:hypothetical protein